MTSKNIAIADKLAREELLDMVPYQSARRLFSAGESSTNGGQTSSKIWLNANEASGPGIYQLNSNCINRYPDFQPESLLNAYSQYSQLPKNKILATRGADEGIELIIRTFCKAYQDSILICPPTYGMYAISAENHGAKIVKVPLLNNELDIEGLQAQVGKVKVVFLCSPGNPTGNLLPQAQLKSAIELFSDSAMVVVDEAYIEFCPEQSVSSWLTKYDNLVVLRTLSKAFALAGLRCGFTLANEEVITLLSKVIAPYPVPAPVADIASKALNKEGLGQMTCRVEENTILRQQLSAWLTEQTWCEKVYPSDANFILFKTNNGNKDFIFDSLVEQGILIRDQSKQMQLENCLRISLGSEREINLLKQTINLAFANKN
jgi:histidinol-phosphate aminotransferase